MTNNDYKKQVEELLDIIKQESIEVKSIQDYDTLVPNSVLLELLADNSRQAEIIDLMALELSRKKRYD